MRRLGLADAPMVQALCERCADYYTLVQGAPAGPTEGETLLTELPPGRGAADKFVFAIEGGVVDLVRDFRVPGEWYLGLLLFAPEARSQGRGARALEQVVTWLREQGVVRLRLAVAEQNVRALKFWQRQGFQLDQRFPPRVIGTRETVLLELKREL